MLRSFGGSGGPSNVARIVVRPWRASGGEAPLEIALGYGTPILTHFCYFASPAIIEITIVKWILGGCTLRVYASGALCPPVGALTLGKMTFVTLPADFRTFVIVAAPLHLKLKSMSA